MSEDTFTIVSFRRQRTYQEFEADDSNTERFVAMGDTWVGQVPDEGKFIFLNGKSYKILNVTWSIQLPERPGQPVFTVPQAMVTVEEATDHGNVYAPKEDFFSQ